MNTKTITTFTVCVIIAVAALAAVSFLRISYPLSVTTSSVASELAVVGEGKVDVSPDTAFIDLGITVNNLPSVEEVQKTIDKTNNQIIAAMKAMKIEKSQIKTTNYSIYPNIAYEGSVNRIIGYNGNVTITVQTRNTQDAPTIIEKGTQAGANQVQGVRFSIEKPETYREQARSKAIAAAKEQAKKLAASLGIKLGRVVNVVETTPSTGSMYDLKMGMGGAGGSGMPAVEGGTQTVSSVVTLYFEKK